MTDDETIEQIRRELRGETPLGSTHGEDRLLFAALGREVRDLNERVRRLEDAGRR